MEWHFNAVPWALPLCWLMRLHPAASQMPGCDSGLLCGVGLDDVRVTCTAVTQVSHHSTQISQLSTDVRAAKQQGLSVLLKVDAIQPTLHHPSHKIRLAMVLAPSKLETQTLKESSDQGMEAVSHLRL